MSTNYNEETYPTAMAVDLNADGRPDLVIPDDLHLDKNTMSLNLEDNTSDTLEATLDPDDSDGTDEIKWTAKPDDIVEIEPAVGSEVIVTAKKAGTATITASYVDVDDECVVTVTAASSPDPDPDEPGEDDDNEEEPEMTEYEKLNTPEAKRRVYKLSESVPEKTVNGKKIPEWAKRNKYRLKKVLKDRVIVRAGYTYVLALPADAIEEKTEESSTEDSLEPQE